MLFIIENEVQLSKFPHLAQSRLSSFAISLLLLRGPIFSLEYPSTPVAFEVDVPCGQKLAVAFIQQTYSNHYFHDCCDD